MPMAWERKLGVAFDLPLEAVRCEDKQAQASLDMIVERLDPKARAEGFTIEMVKLDEANAAALPGGRMVVLSGLFEDIDNPDALAGIVAHEIAHVRRRHVAAAMVRELGLGTVLTLLGGGAVATNAGGLLSLKFSRSAESEADADAVAMLRQAGIDPRPTAAAFEEFRKKEGDWPEWLGDHPASAGRAKLFAASFDANQRYRPTLNPVRAKQLIGSCKG
jgi:predicted Zn-dependent protease